MIERYELAPGYSISRLVNGSWQLSSGHSRDSVDRQAIMAGEPSAIERAYREGFWAILPYDDAVWEQLTTIRNALQCLYECAAGLVEAGVPDPMLKVFVDSLEGFVKPEPDEEDQNDA